MEVDIGLPSRYKIEKRLGSGGVGTVYRAADTQLQRTVAVKVLGQIEPGAKASIIDEFKILSRLSHPCLVQVLDFGFCIDGEPYFSMEYIDGPDLQTYFSSDITTRRVPEILVDVLSALHFLCSRNIIHGDIKPENILIRDHGTGKPVLLDFGLSSITGHQVERISGTLRFLAPEVLQKKHYSTQSDLYALGHTLIECVSDRDTPPAHKITADSIRESHEYLTRQFSSVNLSNSANLATIITDMAQPDLVNRTRTPISALQHLRALNITAEPAFLFGDETHVERKKEELRISEFLNEDPSECRVQILEGTGGSGKKTLMQKFAGKAQMDGYLVINLLSISNLTTDSLLEILASNLPSETGEALLKQHRDNVKRLKRIETPKELINILALHDHIISAMDEISSNIPILLLIPDIECQNNDFIEFLEQTIHEGHLYNSRTKFIVSLNTDSSMQDAAKLAINKILDRNDTTVDKIRGFTKREFDELLITIFQENVFSEDERRVLFENSRGIPSVIVDFLKNLLNNGVITNLGGSYHIDRSRLNLKPEYDDVLSDTKSLFDRLPENQLRILQTIAVYHSPIPERVAKYLFGIDSASIIDDSYRRGFLDQKHGILRIASPSYSKYLIESMDSSSLKDTHRRIADFLSESEIDQLSLIAEHYIAAEALEKAIQYGINAINAHLEKHEYYSARTLLIQLLATIDDQKEQYTITLRENLCTINQTLGLIDEALTGYRELVEEAEQVIDQAKYENRIGNIYYLCLGNTEEAKRHFQKAVSLLSDSDSPLIHAEALISLGTIECSTAHLEEAAKIVRDVDDALYVRAISNAVYFYTLSGDKLDQQRALNELATLNSSSDPDILRSIFFAQYVAAFFQGNYSLAASLIEKLLNVVEMSGDEIRRIYYMSVLGGLFYIQGQFLEQIDTLNNALQRIRKFRAYSHLLTVLSNLSLGYIFLALYRESINCVETGLADAQTYSISELPPYFFSTASRTYSYLGNEFEGKRIRMATEHQRLATESNNRISMGHLSMRQGDFKFWNIEWRSALDHFNESAKIFQSTNTRDDNVEALLKSALCQIELGDYAKGRADFEQAEVEFEAIGCNYLLSLYWYVKGLLESHEGSGSQRALHTALDVSSRQGTRETTWQIQRALARHYLGGGNVPEATKYYKGAVGTLKQITETFQDDTMVRSYLSVPIRRRLFEEIHSLRERI